MKKFLIGAATGAFILAVAPAIAQVTPAPAATAPAAKVHTRADVQAKVAEHFARLDANRDGFVTQAEAQAVRGEHRAERQEHRSERREMRREHTFERLDANNDGSISKAEFDAAHAGRDARVGKRHARRMAGGMGHMAGFHGRMFEMADANKDQRVSLQEATGAALQHFDRADTNHDGQITREERRQMHQQMRAERPGS